MAITTESFWAVTIAPNMTARRFVTNMELTAVNIPRGRSGIAMEPMEVNTPPVVHGISTRAVQMFQ